MAESMLSSPAARSAPRADEATARIESLSHEGAGVAHVDGKATFIDGALPGEHVRFRYRKRRARYDTGAVLEVLEPSPDRVTPPCRYFGVCGGCTLQHLAAPAQLAAKQQILAETLAHVGRVQPERWLPAIAGPDRGYRRRARLGARVVPKKGGVLVGFRERRRSYITSLHECLTLDPRLSALLAPLHALIGGLSRPDRLPQALTTVLQKRIRMQGFIILDHYGERFEAYLREMEAWVASGRIRLHEEIVDGLENAPAAFIGLLQGRNLGKLVVRVAGD